MLYNHWHFWFSLLNTKWYIDHTNGDRFAFILTLLFRQFVFNFRNWFSIKIWLDCIIHVSSALPTAKTKRKKKKKKTRPNLMLQLVNRTFKSNFFFSAPRLRTISFTLKFPYQKRFIILLISNWLTFRYGMPTYCAIFTQNIISFDRITIITNNNERCSQSGFFAAVVAVVHFGLNVSFSAWNNNYISNFPTCVCTETIWMQQ